MTAKVGLFVALILQMHSRAESGEKLSNNSETFANKAVQSAVVDELTAAILMEPDNARLYSTRATQLMRLGRLSEALIDAKKAKFLAQENVAKNCRAFSSRVNTQVAHGSQKVALDEQDQVPRERQVARLTLTHVCLCYSESQTIKSTCKQVSECQSVKCVSVLVCECVRDPKLCAFLFVHVCTFSFASLFAGEVP